MPSKDERPGKLLVVFENREDALKLTNSMNADSGAETDAANGTLSLVEGKTLHFFRKPSRFSKSGSINKKSLFLRNLNYQIEEYELEDLFSKFGEIRNIAIMKDRDTGLPKGIAFVNFMDDGPAEAAIEELDGTEFRGRDLRV